MALTKIDDRGLTTPIDLLDNEKIRFGTGNDLELYHDPSNGSFIKNGAGSNLLISANGSGCHVYIQGKDGEDSIIAERDGAVKLYYDNSKKLQTNSTGIQPFGNVDIQSGGHVYLEDNGKVQIGNSQDLQIFHDGTHTRIYNSTGNLSFKSSAYYFNNVLGTENCLDIIQNGAVNLYYDSVKKFETNGDGIEIYGNCLMDGDNRKIILGASDDLQIYHDGTESRIQTSNGPLDLRTTSAANVEILANDKYSVWCEADGMTALYHNGARKLQTDTNGVVLTGVEGSGVQLYMYADEGDDNADKWRFSASANGSFYLQNYAAGSYESSIIATGNGNVELYYDNVKKIETTSAGLNLHEATDKVISFSGGIGEIGNVTGLQTTNTANNALVPFGMRGSDIRFAAGSAERGRFTDNGLTFNGDTASSNALDDYETGTWTPTYTASGSNPTLTSHLTTGYYTKVGNLVTVTHYTGSFTLSGSPSGTPYIGGLPYTAKSTGNNYATNSFTHTTCFTTAAGGYVSNGGNTIVVIQHGDTTNGATWESSGTRYLMIHFTYLAA